MRAIETYTATGEMPRDLGGEATTQQVTDAICDLVTGANQ